MIEKVMNERETECTTGVRIPKNIKQIGENSKSRKIYVEDYVMNNLKKKPSNEDKVKYGVLLGEIKRSKGITYVFIKGMMETREVIENSIIFNDDIWSDMYKDLKQYFNGLEIIGWFVNVPYTVTNEMSSIKKLHLDNFAGNDKVCFISDRSENEDGFFAYESGDLKKQSGYYIFYEKNEPMKKYLQQTKGQRGVEGERTESKDSSQSLQPRHMSFRDIIKQQITEESQAAGARGGKITYALSSLLIIALLLSTVVMMNNYGELKNLKQSIDNIDNDGNIVAVNEMLSSMFPTTTQNENSEGEVATEAANIGISDNNLNTNNQTTEQEENGMTSAQNGENIGNNNGELTNKNGVNISSENNGSQSSGNNGSLSSANETNSSTGNGGGVSSDENSTTEHLRGASGSIYSGMYHTVKKGQTLYDISVKYYGDNSMVDAIKNLNGIDDDYMIKEGQTIVLP